MLELILTWIGNHPILSVIFAVIFSETLVRFRKAGKQTIGGKQW